MAPLKDRIIDLRRVRASDLRPSPHNWRTHPAPQRDALRTILGEVGLADAVIARETPEGLELVDGHLRAEEAGDQQVPVLVVDLDESEAKKVLATLDPIGSMADTDRSKLTALMEDLGGENEALDQLLMDVAKAQRANWHIDPPEDFPEVDGDLETDYRCPKCGYEWSGKQVP